MKGFSITLFAICMLFTTACFSQATMTIDNQSSCDLFFKMFEVSTSNCAGQSATIFNVTAGSTLTVNAQSGNEWVSVEVSQGICPTNTGVFFSMTSDASGGCTMCGGSAPFGGAQTLGCGSCQRGVDGDWFSCSGKIVVK